MSDIRDIMQEKICDAELVLVGIGEEFGDALEKMREISELADALEKAAEEEKLRWLTPYIEAVYVKKYKDDKKIEAYGILEKLLADKNYFVISLRMDDAIYNTELKREKIVTPCGGYRFLQCVDGCEDKVQEVDERVQEEVYDCIKAGGNLNAIQPPLCPVCGKQMVYNNKKVPNYVEAGYLEDWKNYTRWLQGTVNKKVCVLELGVGMQFPNVIRWPFEKIVYFNQKASMFRVHSKLYQLTEEIKERGYKVEEKPIDFLINRFV